jgi:hypothetical protein
MACVVDDAACVDVVGAKGDWARKETRDFVVVGFEVEVKVVFWSLIVWLSCFFRLDATIDEDDDDDNDDDDSDDGGVRAFRLLLDEADESVDAEEEDIALVGCGGGGGIVSSEFCCTLLVVSDDCMGEGGGRSFRTDTLCDDAADAVCTCGVLVLPLASPAALAFFLFEPHLDLDFAFPLPLTLALLGTSVDCEGVHLDTLADTGVDVGAVEAGAGLVGDAETGF